MKCHLAFTIVLLSALQYVATVRADCQGGAKSGTQWCRSDPWGIAICDGDTWETLAICGQGCDCGYKGITPYCSC
ncbi:hypothetical protein BT63DRAFT_420939 [Microthyrium microscopicum]|uniref:Invertebrate defensins family profile domain-containing protein n=1 Tax=Microthyrium microscopicum TaxID=703497 RepID=A0A6A6UPA3_9PEZI|nr:hypothetical protein BT63DRAFT_420939 [Microthyrium microscopicum]